MRNIAVFLFIITFASTISGVPIGSDIINDPDTPSAGLYSSGSGDSQPANLSSNTDAAVGDYSLRVQSGTVRNGGGTFGGFAKSIPTMEVGKRYSIVYWAKALTAPFTQTFSIQNGSGDTNNLSHSVSLTNEWQEFTYTNVLNIYKYIMYSWGDNGSVMLIDNIRIFEVSDDTPSGLQITSVIVPEAKNFYLLVISITIFTIFRFKL